LEVLKREGFTVKGYFYNPNIHPSREFLFRLEAYRDMAEHMELPAMTEEGYGLEAFMTALKEADSAVYKAKSPERCRICYRLRMEKAASACRYMGLEAFTTSLLVSPYQNHDWIREAGEQAALSYGVAFLYRDFRPGFRQGQAKARGMRLYMQNYCGCVFSEYERYGGGKTAPEQGCG